MGPIGVKSHLAPFLPTNAFVDCGGDQPFGAICSAPFGSASILTISYSYILQLGFKGIQSATALAILNANYIMNRVKDKYTILYTGQNGRCAHEFIIDFRAIKVKRRILI